ncbi:MAG: VIT1/CCC1 transporter family protein [Phycisphaerales bacterium]|nr:VIT1/CCC1 transporter family protein [Phycisphaerales bacterium]
MSHHNDIRAEHSPAAIRARIQADTKHSYIKDFIYGAIDGAVTTFAIVAASAGAGLSSGIIIVLGLANLLADGFSMAASNYLGTKADQQLFEKTKAEEHREIETHPEGEIEEIRQIFAAQGFEGENLEHVVEVITGDRELWVKTMMREEHGLEEGGPEAMPAAKATFVAFLVVGAVPLMPYFIGAFVDVPMQFIVSCAMTAFAFLMVGWVKGQIVGVDKLRSALETLAIGGSAAAVAYIVGVLLQGMAG